MTRFQATTLIVLAILMISIAGCKKVQSVQPVSTLVSTTEIVNNGDLREVTSYCIDGVQYLEFNISRSVVVAADPVTNESGHKRASEAM